MAEYVNKIECPHCGKTINVEDELFRKTEENVRLKIAAEYKEKQEALTKKENELKEREKDQEKNLQEELKKREQLFKLELAQEVKSEYENKLSALTSEIEKRDSKLHELETKELELEKLKLQMAAKDREHELNLEKERIKTQAAVEQEIMNRESEKYEMRIREKDKKLTDLEKQIAELKRKSEQGSVQLQGEVQELAIEDILRGLFPEDEVKPVPKGKSGADTILLVHADQEHVCGKMLYESKRTKSFSSAWIEKLKADQRKENADIAILVTEAMPPEIEHIGNLDGVWVCSFTFLKPLSVLLRDSILKVHSARTMKKNASDKMSLLYDYLTGNEFKMQIEAILEGFLNLKQSIDKEKLAMEKLWKEREKQLEKVLLSTTQFYGSIKGIAGSGVPEIGLLDFEGT
ncbi:MAG: DUF2130 domain-containing protein [Spirochaetales bacterium]|nr:DUF2130 domain-containing protein [Spirochaetales bacterium]